MTGEEHYSVIYDIQESPITPGVIWVGANDGKISVTRDGGENWADVTPPMPPLGRVQNIEASPHQPGKAYASVLRYQLNDSSRTAGRPRTTGQAGRGLPMGPTGSQATIRSV